MSEGTEVAESPEALERQAQVATKEESEASEATSEVRVHEDHTREMKTPGFSRMRTDWHGVEGQHVMALRAIVDARILNLFPDAFIIMNDLYDIVREQAHDPVTGEALYDARQFAIWARKDNGAYIEDYSKLGIREREDFLFKITTNIFEWKQRQADLWGDAMFAKAIWEEVFANGFTEGSGKNLTVDYRTNQARVSASDERYFAIFQSLLSRKADAVVSGMELIGQRLKDVIV